MMKCEACRTRPATVHKLAGGGGARWLCEQCAAVVEHNGWSATESPATGDAFLVDDLTGSADGVCPACGWTAARFRTTQRLGCPACYAAFRSLLMPLLGRLHRHVSHLGKAPRQEGAQPGRLATITRTRAALEKAIAAEDFEEAANLRDRIHSLEALPPKPEEAP